MTHCYKEQHATPEAARRAMASLLKHKGKSNIKLWRGRPLNVYRCEECGTWHIGHLSAAKARELGRKL